MLFAALAWLGYRGWRVYALARALEQDAREIRQAAAIGSPLERIAALRPALAQARGDAAALRAEAGFALPLARHLGWAPVYGADLAAAAPLLDAAADLTVAADEALQALAPIAAARAPAEPLGVALATHLAAERPRLEAASQALGRASANLSGLRLDQLSPTLREQLTPLMALLGPARDGLDLALALPDLLGASGQRRYLLIAQNPDELRPTGGLITAAGTLTVERGRLVGFAIGDSSAVDDLANHPYPDPPAPIARYLGVDLWVFRDSNWSPDFPTAARKAAAFYQLGRGGEIDGVLAVTPAALRTLLAATGPIQVAGAREPITADTIIPYMRNSLLFAASGGGGAQAQPWWRARKDFLAPLAQAIIARLSAEPASLSMPAILDAARRMLDDRDLQISLNNPAAAALLARRGWDGALRPGSADFLMLVSANLGYNKVTPNVAVAAAYTVDLSDPAAPLAELTVLHTHRLAGPAACDQRSGFDDIIRIQRYEEMMSGCEWDYLRAVVPGDSELIAGFGPPVPPEWLLTGAEVDQAAELSAGDAGTAEIGALVVVPPGEKRRTFFRYRLPAAVLYRDARGYHYRLRLQRQPGAAAVPLDVTLRLPGGAALLDSSVAPAPGGGAPTFKLILDRDQVLDVTFGG